jgi:hydroxymethylbilane synthase
MHKKNIVIGTRGSALALVQANWVKDRLEERHPDLAVELLIIKTKGDKILDVPLAKVGGKGLFVKEIEEALLDGRADLAVHSMKDVPAELPEGLFIACVPEREDFRDAIVSRDGKGFEGLARGARIGTSSLRRRAQLLHLRPDFEVVSIRGNLETRLRKIEEENLAAVVLATAGLNRMNLAARISQRLEPEVMIPAIGQGALGIEARRADEDVLDRLAFLNHEPTRICVGAERAFLKKMEGGCQVPLGALARIVGGLIRIVGLVADPDGVRYLKGEKTADLAEAEAAGAELAGELLDRGGREILEDFYCEETGEVPNERYFDV